MNKEQVLLEHITTEIRYIEEFTTNIDKEAFLRSVEKQHAVLRAIEIIGEAVKNLPISVTQKYRSIRWKDIAGTRDILIHAYFSVDLNLVWSIVKIHIPELKEAVTKALECT